MADLPFILLRMDYIPGPPIEFNEASMIALGVVAAACVAVSVVGVMLLVFGKKESGAPRDAVAEPQAARAAPKGDMGERRPEGASAGGAAPSARTARPGGGAAKTSRGDGGRAK